MTSQAAFMKMKNPPRFYVISRTPPIESIPCPLDDCLSFKQFMPGPTTWFVWYKGYEFLVSRRVAITIINVAMHDTRPRRLKSLLAEALHVARWTSRAREMPWSGGGSGTE
jgi:hypothetical protein